MPEQITKDSVVGDELHHWTIQEYQQYRRPMAWFVMMGIAGAILIFLSLLWGNFLFLVIILLFGIILFLQSEQEPATVPFSITNLGIMVGNRLYVYDELESFYIIYHPPQVKSLYFETKSVWRPRVHVPLDDQNPLDIRDTLLEHLKEDLEKEEEPMSEKLARDFQIH